MPTSAEIIAKLSNKVYDCYENSFLVEELTSPLAISHEGKDSSKTIALDLFATNMSLVNAIISTHEPRVETPSAQELEEKQQAYITALTKAGNTQEKSAAYATAFSKAIDAAARKVIGVSEAKATPTNTGGAKDATISTINTNLQQGGNIAKHR